MSGIRVADALRVPWPRASVIVGNPPFHGDATCEDCSATTMSNGSSKRSDAASRTTACIGFARPTIISSRDSGPGSSGEPIAQNGARSASLNYLAERGGVITDAVSSQPWPGEAVVEVAIVNWVKEPDAVPGRFVLDGLDVDGIDTALQASTLPIADVAVLPGNKGRAFQGVIPRGDGFVLTHQEGVGLRERPDADYRMVVRPYLGGKDMPPPWIRRHRGSSSTSATWDWSRPCDFPRRWT